MEKRHRFTARSGEIFTDSLAGAITFYAREDLARELEKLAKADPEARPVYEARLERMCTARGISREALRADPALLLTVPTRRELLEQLLTAFYKTCHALPTAQSYMERLVRTLAPEYGHDPVRLAILKKYVQEAGFDCRQIDIRPVETWVKERMTEDMLRDYEAAEPPKRLKMLVGALDDSIFSSEQPGAKLTDTDRLTVILKMLQSASRYPLSDALGSSVSPEDLGCLPEKPLTGQRPLLSSLGLEAPATLPELLTLLLNTLKGRTLTRTQAQALSRFTDALHAHFTALTRSVFYPKRTGGQQPLYELYDQRLRDLRKARRRTGGIALAALCSDLAWGNFKTNNGQTRVELYHFAFLFGMTFRVDEKDPCEPMRDIQTHLFQNYYCDNLTRYLYEPDAAAAQEREPAGDGINYKNFAEVIYLYYLHKADPSLTPGQRIDRAESMIEACLRASPGQKPAAPKPGIHTRHYRLSFLSTVLNAKEEELVDRVLRCCPISLTGLTKTEHAAHTATACAEALLTLQELTEGREYMAYDQSESRREENLEDAAFSSSFLMDWALVPLLKEKFPHDKPFLRLVDNIHERLCAQFDWIGDHNLELLVRLLYVLYHHTAPGAPIRGDRLHPVLRKANANSNNILLKQCMEHLKLLGFRAEVYSGMDEGLLVWDMDTLRTLPGKKAWRSAAKKLSKEESALLEALPGLLEGYAQSTAAVPLSALSEEMGKTPAELAPILERLGIGQDCTRDTVLFWPRSAPLTCAKEDAVQALTALSGRCCAIRLRQVQALLPKAPAAGTLAQAFETLCGLSEDITFNGTDDCLFVLLEKEDDHPLRSALLQTLHSPQYLDMTLARSRLSALAATLPPREKKVTRTALLALKTNQYVGQIHDTYGLNTFQDIYEDLLSTVNPILEDCRFQTLHEKNVLDLFLILSVYLYVLENGSEEATEGLSAVDPEHIRQVFRRERKEPPHGK